MLKASFSPAILEAVDRRLAALREEEIDKLLDSSVGIVGEIIATIRLGMTPRERVGLGLALDRAETTAYWRLVRRWGNDPTVIYFNDSPRALAQLAIGERLASTGRFHADASAWLATTWRAAMASSPSGQIR